MNPNLQHLMREATRLTRLGDLRGATAAIQAALTSPPTPPRADADADTDADVIDVEARVVPDAVHVLDDPAQPQSPPSPPAQHDEAFIAARHAGPAGQRDYKLFVPPLAHGSPPLRPLIVMLHGCTQHPDDFAAGTAMNDAARAAGCLVLYPAQTQRANAQRCWNWFKHNHQQRGRGEPALLAAMTREVMARWPVDPARVHVAGLSAGGAMAAILGEAYPELFASVGVHSGLAAGAAADLPAALAAMRQGGGAATRTRAPSGVPTIVFHGDADTTVHARNGEQVVAASAGAAAAVETEHGQRAGGSGRRFTRRIHRAADGRVAAEHWVVHGAPHAWSGGRPAGSHTDAHGPDATREMLRFFLEHPRRDDRRG
jgi:poly(hydroxyalkanoate) depolymerase family esterase